jgi:hypothetical protein
MNLIVKQVWQHARCDIKDADILFVCNVIVTLDDAVSLFWMRRSLN